jgi:hypothetical protein
MYDFRFVNRANGQMVKKQAVGRFDRLRLAWKMAFGK